MRAPFTAPHYSSTLTRVPTARINREAPLSEIWVIGQGQKMLKAAKNINIADIADIADHMKKRHWLTAALVSSHIKFQALLWEMWMPCIGNASWVVQLSHTIYSIHIIGHAVAAVGRQTVKIKVCLRLRVEILHQSVHKGILRVLGKSWTIQKNERRAEL